jgi:hypothetical protein
VLSIFRRVGSVGGLVVDYINTNYSTYKAFSLEL